MASDMDYLAEDFDPASLTVPRLRSILVEHSVAYPSSAKKSQLVDLFNDSIVPQARKLVKARSRTKPTTKGIIDVPPPSSQASTIAPEDEIAPPPTVKSSRKSRASTARTTAPPEEEPAPRPAARRTRLSSVTPVVKREDSEPTTWHEHSNESPFTADNPFQSGSSPPAESFTVDRDRRRKTLGIPEDKERRKSRSTSRRKTDTFQMDLADADGALVSKSYHLPIAGLKNKVPIKQEPDLYEPGEEFTPDEQLALERDQAESGTVGTVARRRQPPTRTSGAIKNALTAITVALLGGFAALWRQEKLDVGYCGVGSPSALIGGVEIPEWADFIRPQCEPCPPHARCFQDLKTECDQDFVLKPHPLSVGGLVPLPPTCEPDSEKARKVKAVADRVVEVLRERTAKAECGELTDENGKHTSSSEFKEAILKETVSAQRRKGMSQSEFEDLWRAAIGDVLQRDEIISQVDENGSYILTSTSLARIPLGCAIRRSVRLTLERNLWKLVSFLMVLASAGYARLSITSARATEEQAKQLASYALDRLATHAAQHLLDPSSTPEAWVSMTHLRDDILRDEFSAAKRTKLWEKVQKKVEQNSNVRPSVREGRHGDVSRVWEWVGAVHTIEGAPANIRRSGGARYSLTPFGGSEVDLSGPIKSEDTPSGGEPMVQVNRKWDEGRPIY